MNEATFPHPHHDHAACQHSALERAEARCRARGTKLTELRRRVFGIVAASHQPVGAYDIIARFHEPGEAPPAPITVYRALDFLMGEGLVHRIASRNAYLACTHAHEGGDPVVFLICESCGDAGEIVSESIGRAIREASSAEGFAPRQQVIEISGICRNCQSRHKEQA